MLLYVCFNMTIQIEIATKLMRAQVSYKCARINLYEAIKLF